VRRGKEDSQGLHPILAGCTCVKAWSNQKTVLRGELPPGHVGGWSKRV
jgi:hypothetical protein